MLPADGTHAGPCSAERVLELRLALGLPTVLNIKRHGVEIKNLRSRSVQLLKQSKNVVLSRPSEEDRESGGMSRYPGLIAAASILSCV